MLALNGAGSEACDVLIDGVFVRRIPEFTFLDEAAIIARAREWCDQFASIIIRWNKRTSQCSNGCMMNFNFPKERTSMTTILIKGGYLITMDAEDHRFYGDLLIEGNCIEQIGPKID